MAPNGQNGIRGQYQFVDGVWKYTRILDPSSSSSSSPSSKGKQPSFDERTPLIGDTHVAAILNRHSATSSTSSRPSIRSSADTLTARSSSDASLESGNPRKSVTEDDATPRTKAIDFINRNVDSVKGLVDRVMAKIIDRGERLDTLRERAENLGDVSEMFRRRTGRAHTETWLEAHKVRALCGVVTTWLIALVIS
ncbi:hypothetical protein HDU96_007101 [Phlyctochytrium bullatum]|nr:hypothetical protein HDU96_007101 [Phlyctochytrium bullatum]